ncbi:MAG: GTPase domain-containing protein [Thermoplasmatales archaeon]
MRGVPNISKILVVGPRGAGKTSLICRIVYDSLDECSQIPGQFMRYNYIKDDGNSIQFLFKEVNYLPAPEKKAGYILVLDSNNKSDLESLPNILKMISDKNFIVALCKSDLHYSAAFWIDDVRKIVGEKIEIVPVSATTGENVKVLIEKLSNMVSS